MKQAFNFAEQHEATVKLHNEIQFVSGNEFIESKY